MKPTWREVPVDGGLLRFERDTGTNVLVRSEATRALRRQAPRSLQIGLLTPCNLACSFCYRDAAAPSLLTREFLLELLEQAAAWGVLEVAFGGGEPLLFKGFIELLRDLHARTPLGLNLTSNGVLLTEERIEALAGVVGEVRISAYADNDYRATLRRARRLPLGVNLLVTPASVHRLEVDVADILALGARNVLLLGYKGADPTLHLGADGLRRLTAAVRRMAHLPLRLDICWYPLLTDVAHLFERADCGAGDEFLVITPDRAVQPCSFHHERIPFATFAELRAIYEQLRARRPAASVAGCTRAAFATTAQTTAGLVDVHRLTRGLGPASWPALTVTAPAPTVTAPAPTAWVWQARASNNSGDWTIAARFCDEATARRVADELRELARVHEAFLASDEGQAFVEKNGYDGSIPTPPLRAFAEARGFTWREGLWWEEDGYGAPVLTAGAVGDAVVVYHPYCMGLPEATFRELFVRAGAVAMGYWQYGRPRVVVQASGSDDVGTALLERHLATVNAAKYSSDVKTPPPWGALADDPRLQADEDRDARLSDGPHELTTSAGQITLRLAFENSFAGTLALERWLQARGFTDVVTELEPLPPLPAPTS